MCVLVAQLWLMPEIHSELIQTNTGFIAVLWVKGLALNLLFLIQFSHTLFQSTASHCICSAAKSEAPEWKRITGVQNDYKANKLLGIIFFLIISPPDGLQVGSNEDLLSLHSSSWTSLRVGSSVPFSNNFLST